MIILDDDAPIVALSPLGSGGTPLPPVTLLDVVVYEGIECVVDDMGDDVIVCVVEACV